MRFFCFLNFCTNACSGAKCNTLKGAEKKEVYFGDLPRSILAEWELAAESGKIIKNRAAYTLQKEQQSKEKYIIILIAIVLLFFSIMILFIRNRKYIIEREKTKQDNLRIAFDLELKSKQLVSESLKNLMIQIS